MKYPIAWKIIWSPVAKQTAHAQTDRLGDYREFPKQSSDMKLHVYFYFKHSNKQ